MQKYNMHSGLDTENNIIKGIIEVLQVEKHNRNDIIRIIKNRDNYNQMGNIKELKMLIN